MKRAEKTIYPNANFDIENGKKKAVSKNKKTRVSAGIYKKVLDGLKKGGDAKSVFYLEEKIGKDLTKKIIKQKEKDTVSDIENNTFPDFYDYALVKLKKNILIELQKKFGFDFSFANPPKEVSADLCIPCFTPAKELNVNHVNLTRGVADFLTKRFASDEGAISEVSAVHGYANINFKRERFVFKILKEALKLGDLYGASNVGFRSFIIIDYSSPNIAKPMSVGHLRSTIIGNSLKNIYEFSGFSVLSVNHLGDWGTQFGKLLYALENWGDEKKIKKDSFKEFLNLYVKFHDEAEKNPELNDKAREIFKRLENGEDIELLKKWLTICELSVQEFNKIYKRLNMRFDLFLGESFYKNMAEDAIKLTQTAGVAKKESNGPLVVEFKDSNIPSFLLQKSDGASLYHSRDLAAAIFRQNILFNWLSKQFKKIGDTVTEKTNKIIYVVGSDQNLHFKQLFKTLELLTIGNQINFEHIGFGMMSLPEGKMSTRAGRGVFLEELLDEAEKKSEKLVKEKNPELAPEEVKEIKEAVGIGAVIYADLSQYREKNIVFTWDKMMSMKGDSSPYLQYAFARIQSILRKAGEFEFVKPEINNFVMEKEEYDLVFAVSLFPETVNEAREEKRPDKIANYLNDLVKKFNRFYENVPVLTVQGDMLNFRLTLIKSAGQVIKNGLWLLGIKVVNKM